GAAGAAERTARAQAGCPPGPGERAGRLVLETSDQPGTRQGAVGRVARQLGIGVETLRGWVKRAEVDGGRRPGVPTEQQRRLAELEQGGPGAAPGQRDPQGRLGLLRVYVRMRWGRRAGSFLRFPAPPPWLLPDWPPGR